MDLFVPLNNNYDHYYNHKMSCYRKFDIIYKILMLLILIFITIFLTFTILDLKLKSSDTINNINTFALITTQVIEEHNVTFVSLENKINYIIDKQNSSLIKIEKEFSNTIKTFNFVLDILNQILIDVDNNFNTPNVTNKILNIIDNINIISSNLNVTSFQENLSSITTDVSKISDNIKK